MGALSTLFGGADTSGVASNASSIGGGAKSGYDTFEKNKLPPGHDTYQPSTIPQQSIGQDQQQPAQGSSYADLMNYLKGGA